MQTLNNLKGKHVLIFVNFILNYKYKLRSNVRQRFLEDAQVQFFPFLIGAHQ